MNQVHQKDLEKQENTHTSTEQENSVAESHSFGSTLASLLAVKDGEVYKAREKNPAWYQRLLDAGFEENGIKPVPLEQRTSRKYNNLFTVFLSCLLCLLP